MDDAKLNPEITERTLPPTNCADADSVAQADVHRMLAHAAGTRSVVLEAAVMDKAVTVTALPVAVMTPDDRIALYRVHDALAAAIAPATPDGVRTLNVYQQGDLRDRRCRAVLGASIWSLGGLLLAMSVHAYVAGGSLIVQTIEGTRKDVAQVQAQIRDFDAAHPSNTVLGGPRIDALPTRENERQRLHGAAKSNGRRFDTAHDRLISWLYMPLDTLGIANMQCTADQIALQIWALHPAPATDATPATAAAPADHSAKRTAIMERCKEPAGRLLAADADTLNEAYYSARQAHEQNARAAMELFSVVILPLVFGLLGASLAVLRENNRRLHEGSLDLTTLRCAAMRRLLGAAVGGISGIFFTPTHVLENWGLSLVALAFLLGFSVDIAFRVFQRLSDRVAEALGGGEATKAAPTRS